MLYKGRGILIQVTQQVTALPTSIKKKKKKKKKEEKNPSHKWCIYKGADSFTNDTFMEFES